MRRRSAAHPKLLLFACLEMAEVGGQRLAPAVVAAAVHDLEQRPTRESGCHGSSLSVPVISAISERGLRNEMPAQTPSCPVPRPRMCEQPLAQPALDTLRRDDDEFLGERVVQRVRKEVAEAVSQEIGSFSAVEMECHRASDYDGPVAAFDESLKLADHPAEFVDHPALEAVRAIGLEQALVVPEMVLRVLPVETVPERRPCV